MAVINITKENFAQEVLHSEKPVLLDFWASWCGPCRMLSPVVDEVAEERTDVKVASWCVRLWAPAPRPVCWNCWAELSF